MIDLARPYKRAALQLFRALNTPRALSCFLLTKHGEWDQLATIATDPSHYLDAPSGIEKYRKDIQASDFLRKSASLPTTVDKKKAAIDSFWQSEKLCHQTNQFLLTLVERSYSASQTPVETAYLGILAQARKICSRVLGAIPQSIEGGFGPGTSFELKGSAYNTLADKLTITPHVTRDAYAVWRHTFDGSFWDRRRLALGLPDHAIARGNRFTTVPKDGKTDRGICIEPLGNIYAQLGVGRYLKRRLASVGLFVQRNNAPLDPVKLLTYRGLPNGQEIHRKLAEMASLDGSWSTIDLSSASDTVALELVRLVLPPDWFTLLTSLRSPYTRMPNGDWVHLDKFSSMGNGFTFELETLIFAALCSAVTGLRLGEEVFVYGDDIIVPTHASKDVLAVLRMSGFIPNVNKTFTTGLFKESCGGDYFSGVPVRAYQSKKEPASPPEWIAMHNEIKAKFPFLPKWVFDHIVDQVPVRFRCFGPARAGNSVLHSHPSKWRTFVRDDIRWLRGVATVPRRIPLDRWGDEWVFVLATLGVSSSGISPRGEISGWKTVLLSVS